MHNKVNLSIVYYYGVVVVVNSHGGEVVRRPNVVFTITINKERKL